MWIKMATKQNLRSFSWSKLRRILGNRWINSHNSSCLFVSLHLFFFHTCRFWGSVRRRRPAVTTASEHLCVSVLIGKWKWVYCVYKLSYLYSPPSSYMSPPYWNKVFLFLQKKKKEAVLVNQVSVNSENPSHSSFRENYEYGFGGVVFESAPGWIAGLWALRNTCWQTLITYEIQC